VPPYLQKIFDVKFFKLEKIFEIAWPSILKWSTQHRPLFLQILDLPWILIFGMLSVT
jgi:hypothetical protein